MSKNRIAWNAKATAAANARRELPGLVSRYFAEVRGALAKQPSPAELHQLRLATKRLRYTLELFRPCYGPGLETRISTLRDLQQILGEINDAAATGRLLANSMPASAQRTRAVKLLENRAAEKAVQFHRHWQEVFDAAGRERWWTVYLERQAR